MNCMRTVRGLGACVVTALTVVVSSRNVLAIAANSWTPVSGTLSQAREMPAMVTLADQRVLVIGGTGTAGLSNAVDTYDPTTNAFVPAAPMNVSRVFMGTTRLKDGRVLVTGGQSVTGFIASTEIFDPALNTWTPAADLPYAAFALKAVTLADGRVLAMGGYGDSGLVNSSALYTPATNTWTLGPSMAHARELPEAVRLADGRVLVAGGFGDDALQSALSSAELFDPLTSTWSAAGQMSAGHALGFGLRLSDGRAMVGAGVSNGSQEQVVGAIDVYDPATGQWQAVAPLASPRFYVAAGVLSSGTVVVAGGITATIPAFTMVDTVETYDPAQNAWLPFAPLSAAKFAAGGGVSGDRFIVAGGASDTMFNNGEVAQFTVPLTAVASVVGLSTVQAVPGSPAAIVVSAEGSTGSGLLTFTWTEGSVVVATTMDPTRTATIGMAIGVHALTLTASSSGGGSSTATVTVTVEDGVGSLQTQIAQLGAQVQQLQQQLTAAGLQVTTLQTELTAAQLQATTLQTQLATAQSQAATAAQQVTTLQTQLAAAQSEAAAAQLQVTTLQTQLAAAQSQAAAARLAIVDAVSVIQSYLRAIFHDRSFVLPGSSPAAQLQTGVRALYLMPHGEFEEMHRRHGGKRR